MNPAIPAAQPHVSINRVRIVDLPGIAVDEAVRGRTAFELLSTRAVSRYAREHVQALALPPALTEDTQQAQLELPRWVAARLTGAEEDGRQAAEAIAHRLGRNLGHILLALQRGDAANRAARADWSDAEWERWQAIRQVWLGGGLASGALGEHILHHAARFLAETSPAAPRLARSPYRQAMTLLGGGRYLPPQPGAALVCDFGHTQAKRACLQIEQGAIVDLHAFTPLLVHIPWLDSFPVHNPHSGRQVLDFMVETVARTWEEGLALGFQPLDDLMLVVAAYVQGGRFVSNGLYANLNTLAADARVLLAAALRHRLGRRLRVHAIHDGAAAAATHAGEDASVSITLGTALGVGFAPQTDAGLLRLAFVESDR